MATTFRADVADASSLLREVARLHVRAQRTTLVCDGASGTTCTILTELGRAPSLTLAQLSRRLRLDKGWTSRAVDQLVADGLIAKTAGDTDRRTISLSLTRAGRAEHARIERVLNDQVARVVSRLPAAQLPATRRVLAALHDAYLAELAGDGADLARPACAEAS